MADIEEFVDLSSGNKINTFRNLMPGIQEVMQALSEVDLSEGYDQLRINEEVSQMTFSYRFGKVSIMLLVLFGDVFVSDVFQSRICNKFMDFCGFVPFNVHSHF